MMRPFSILLIILLVGALLSTLALAGPLKGTAGSNASWCSVQKNIEKYLGKPYALGAVGKKSFDCSGFVWRIMAENGIILKRTTARKLYMCLPSVTKDQYYDSGTLVFFDNLKHIGIVNDQESFYHDQESFYHDQESFYHAQTSKGTNLSRFDPYWRQKIYGFKKIPTR